MDNRSTSALFKRAEQLKRWDESEANKHSGIPKSPSMRRIKFSSGCIFLAACMAGDKDEVSRLLETGADIDTANVDGLTALHQVSYGLRGIENGYMFTQKPDKHRRFVRNCCRTIELIQYLVADW